MDRGVPMPQGTALIERRIELDRVHLYTVLHVHGLILSPRLSLSPSISYSLRRSLVAQNLASNEVSNNCLLMTNWPHARNLVALSAARLMTRRRKDADHWSLNRGRSFLCCRLQELFFRPDFHPLAPWIEGATRRKFLFFPVLNIKRQPTQRY